MTTRIVLYSHDSMGLGHIRRNLALAHAMTAGMPDVTGILIAGRPEATRFAAPDGWDWVILPGVEPADGGYRASALDVDLTTTTSVRGAVFRATMRSFRPDLVVIDRHPLGVARELESGLRLLRAENPDCRIVLGLRDILDTPAAASAEWRALGGGRTLRPLLDAIWVYGDPLIHDLAADGQLPPSLRDLVRHTGYLAAGRHSGHPHDVEGPFVLTTVGGGRDGLDLAIAAAGAAVPAGYRHLVVTGPQMPSSDRALVESAAGPATTVVRRVPDALPLMHRAAAVICMAGYNTICEVMSTLTPALVSPRVQRRAEQRIRTAALAGVGAIDALPHARTDAAQIGSWLAANVGRRVHRSGVSLDGLERIPVLARELLAEPACAIRGGEPVAV
ncbi:glycosyltransferase family protein [Microbacterium sp. NPDC055903]